MTRHIAAMKQRVINFFLNDKIILTFIVINFITIFVQESGYRSSMLTYIDCGISLIFLIEMIVKHCVYGIKEYWKDAWNRFDGILVMVTTPSLLNMSISMNMNLSFLMVLRVLHAFKMFRMIKFFPNIGAITVGLKRAIKDSYSVFFGLFIIMIVFSVFNCIMFGKAAPEYFGNPVESIYSVFRLFTVEGWYEIPDTISTYYDSSEAIIILVKTYFSILLVIGGILGMSLVNSIFVDAMVSDNNDDLEADVKRLEEKIDRPTEKITDLQKNDSLH